MEGGWKGVGSVLYPGVLEGDRVRGGEGVALPKPDQKIIRCMVVRFVEGRVV